MPDTIHVVKRDAQGNAKLEYTGELIERGLDWVCLRALFNFDRVDIGFTAFVRGDVFTEWFYANRWYNIFQVNSREDGGLKGWYCNITRPAQITADTVSADDLALDVFVTPTGEAHIMDEDAFAKLDLPAHEQKAALDAVRALKTAVEKREPPFDLIS